MSPGRQLRESIKQRAIAVVGAPNALAAKMIEQQGFAAAYLSGAALSAGTLAVPDIGLFSRDVLVEQTRILTAAVNIPIIVDADTGFGDEADVAKTISQLEGAGAAAVQLEDQTADKRCGHLSGKSLIDAEVMCGKIRAASDARTDSDFVIVARTDARGVVSLEEALERSQQYIEAGADWIFVEALTSRDEFETVGRALDVPLVANMTEFGKSPLLTVDELSDLGYGAVLFPVTLLRMAAAAMQAALEEITRHGTQAAIVDQMQTRQQLYDVIGYEDFDPADREHFEGKTKGA
ncbi:MAG: methylisocitrate lyase [Pirellulales bacterium]|nr:methylisocitrate lyase [Pirellulales bacterium]